MILSDFKDYVKRDFKRTDKDVELVRAYNDMIRFIAAKLPIGNYKFSSFVTTSIGIEDYELPCDLLHLIHPIKILDGSNSTDSGYSLEHITKQEYDIREPNPNRNNPQTGKPCAYTIFSRSILITPIPDSNVNVLEIDWGKKPATLSVASDASFLESEWDEILKWGTLERLYDGMGRYDEAMYWALKYRDAEFNPIGPFKDLLNAEKDREDRAVSQVRNNSL